ncbi:MAG: DUF1501 domain-containing protein [Planctomycetota bacterium]|nr:MAG: DUF1501 domain-containing protein [Planctomycetota bacterium]
MLEILGRPGLMSKRLGRRAMLQVGGAGLFGLSLLKVMAAEEAALATGPKPRAKSVIFLFLFGGPSQYETFDMKPDAPADIRGPWSPIGCRTPGLRICEHLPKLAAISERYCVIRSMTHDFNDHSGGGHYIQTGHRWQIPVGGGFSATPQDWPSMGSVVEFLEQKKAQGVSRDLPAYAVVPNRLGRLQENGQYVRPGEYGGWLGASANPLTTRVDRLGLADNPYWRDCNDTELRCRIEGLEPLTPDDIGRIRRRATLLESFDTQRRILDGAQSRELDLLRERALGLVTSSRTRDALDLEREPTSLRDGYGRHLFGQACLMARRLVEAGTRFVTVHYDCCDGYGWDSHVHSTDVKNHLLPTFDQALSALLLDLEQRGLLAETLVVALGEMGRTAKPTKDWGRNHWSTLFPAVIAGAGVRGGTTWGASDRNGEYPIEHPTSPEDLAATIYKSLGIDPATMLTMPDGRPVPLTAGGRPIEGIFG